jgi:hypothetical protein
LTHKQIDPVPFDLQAAHSIATIWREQFFHLTDPDGHELSFAWPLR